MAENLITKKQRLNLNTTLLIEPCLDDYDDDYVETPILKITKRSSPINILD